MSVIKNNSNKPLPIDNCSCSMNQRNNKQIEKPSLLCLDGDVLLHVFGYLDLSDSINLAETRKRLHQLSCRKFKKYVELNKGKYLEEGSLPLQNILNTIGPHVQVLKARLSQLNDYDMNSCVNVKSLQILWGLNDVVAADRINRWISQLHLECLWFGSNSKTKTFFELFNGVTNLKELRIDDETIDCREFVSRNMNIERLALNVQHNFNNTFKFEIFSKLRHLKSLHIRLPATKYLNDMTRFGNFNGLTELSLKCGGLWYFDEVNTFLKFLADNTKLDKLRINGRFNENSFTTLKLMNLSALSMYHNDEDREDHFTNFILEYSAPQLKHLQLSGFSMKQFETVVRNWKNLETICVYLEHYEDVEKCLDDAFIGEILKLSTDLPMLNLHVYSQHLRSEYRPCHIEICYESQTFTKNYGREKCLGSTIFGFSGNGCFGV